MNLKILNLKNFKKNYERRNSIIIKYFYGFQKDIYKCYTANCDYINCSFQGITI